MTYRSVSGRDFVGRNRDMIGIVVSTGSSMLHRPRGVPKFGCDMITFAVGRVIFGVMAWRSTAHWRHSSTPDACNAVEIPKRGLPDFGSYSCGLLLTSPSRYDLLVAVLTQVSRWILLRVSLGCVCPLDLQSRHDVVWAKERRRTKKPDKSAAGRMHAAISDRQ